MKINYSLLPQKRCPSEVCTRRLLTWTSYVYTNKDCALSQTALEVHTTGWMWDLRPAAVGAENERWLRAQSQQDIYSSSPETSTYTLGRSRPLQSWAWEQLRWSLLGSTRLDQRRAQRVPVFPANYWSLMGSARGAIVLFSCVPTGGATKSQWTVPNL